MLYLFHLSPSKACLIVADSKRQALEYFEAKHGWRPLEFSSPDINNGQRSTFYPIDEFELKDGLTIDISLQRGKGHPDARLV